jgi:hypothetical protein
MNPKKNFWRVNHCSTRSRRDRRRAWIGCQNSARGIASAHLRRARNADFIDIFVCSQKDRALCAMTLRDDVRARRACVKCTRNSLCQSLAIHPSLRAVADFFPAL